MKRFAYWTIIALTLCSCGQRKSEGGSVEDSIVVTVISEQERAEYEREAASWLAQFDTNAVPEVERRAIVKDYYVEDREITREEFMAAQAEMAKYNYAERERAWMAEDTALVRAESSESHLSIDELMDEVWLGEWPEAGVKSLVLSAGDACWTLIHGDTVCVETCSLVLSRDRMLAGIWKEWGASDEEQPAYLCFHRVGGGPQQEWQTTPAWTPSGRPGFFF